MGSGPDAPEEDPGAGRHGGGQQRAPAGDRRGQTLQRGNRDQAHEQLHVCVFILVKPLIICVHITGARLQRAGVLPGLPGGARLWDQLSGFQRGTFAAVTERRALPAAGSHHGREQPPLCCRAVACRSDCFQRRDNQLSLNTLAANYSRKNLSFIATTVSRNA